MSEQQHHQPATPPLWGELPREEREAFAARKWNRVGDPWARRVIRVMVVDGLGWAGAMEYVRKRERGER